MEARLKIWPAAGQMWWELRTHHSALMTMDRYVDGGRADTIAEAWGDAELAWMHFMSSWKSAA